MIKILCPTCAKALEIPDKFAGQRGKCKYCQGTLVVPLLEAAPPAPSEQHDWRNDPATKKQKIYLRKLGAEPHEITGLTKSEASDLIDDYKAVNKMQRADAWKDKDSEAAKAIRDHTNNQKNCCGIVIIILTAPLWIPFLLYLIGIWTS